MNIKNKRLFLLDNYRVTDSLGKVIRRKSEKDNLEVRICETDSILYRLPRDFDAYILHLSHVNEEDLKELRDEQPWSWIYGKTGAIDLPESIWSIIDRKYTLIDSNCIEEILNEIKEYRKEEKK